MTVASTRGITGPSSANKNGAGVVNSLASTLAIPFCSFPRHIQLNQPLDQVHFDAFRMGVDAAQVVPNKGKRRFRDLN